MYQDTRMFILFVSLMLSPKIQSNIFFFISEIPKFTGPIVNVTVPIGREAVLECGVDNLSTFKVGSIFTCQHDKATLG